LEQVIKIRRLALFCAMCYALPASYAAGLTLAITILDSAGRPNPGVAIDLRARGGGPVLATRLTDIAGRASFPDLDAHVYQIAASKDGFETLRRPADLLAGNSIEIEITLEPLLLKSTVEVNGTVDAVDTTAPAAAVSAATAKQLPGQPATVSDALPLIPGVVRDQGGALLISASAEHRSALIVNSADVTDPATGQFGLTVPMDSVESLNVYQTPYLAEYGRFTAGLVSVETRRGGEVWKWELNDPLPEFRIRSYNLRGLKTATPRLNFEGPLIAHRLFLTEGFEYVVRKTEVYTLPFPRNQKLETGLNSFTQLDWVISDRHLLTGTAHVAPQRLGHVNMDFFNPEQTTPDASIHSYTGTLIDRFSLHGGLLETTFATARFDVGVWGRGNADLVLTPTGNSGNYFVDKSREAARYSGASIYSFAPVHDGGTHNFKVGFYAAASDETGVVTNHPVEIRSLAGDLLERITFTRRPPFDIDDVEKAIFGQDHWSVNSRFSLDLGVRTESQQVSGAFRVAPRGGLAWSPFANTGTVVRAGFGLYYDHVPLNLYAFNRYPDQVITTYTPDGEVMQGPFLFLNVMGQSKVRFPFVSQKPVDGNFSPHSANWSVSVEQPIRPQLRLRATYMQHDSAGLAVLNPQTPDPDTGTGAYLLQGTGQSRYRQFEAMARMRLTDERELFFSYVYSRARGDLNDFTTYLTTFPTPIIRQDLFGNLPGSIPNRFLSWGVFRVTKTFRVAPVIEYRTGFPYVVTDEWQRYAGVPNRNRYPDFISVDARLSKDVKVNAKYSVRLSLAAFNLMNHFNPEAVHFNTADPNFGMCFGHRGRRFTADFDVLF
jgi:hypothetical protein